jgi:hypothetical protein
LLEKIPIVNTRGSYRRQGCGTPTPPTHKSHVVLYNERWLIKVTASSEPSADQRSVLVQQDSVSSLLLTGRASTLDATGSGLVTSVALLVDLATTLPGYGDYQRRNGLTRWWKRVEFGVVSWW